MPQMTFKMTLKYSETFFFFLNLSFLRKERMGIFFFSFLAVMLRSDSLLSNGNHAVGKSLCKTDSYKIIFIFPMDTGYF